MKGVIVCLCVAVVFSPCFIPVVHADELSDLKERVVALEEKLKEPYERGLLSRRGAKFELGGEMEFEFVDTQNHASVNEPEAHFQLDKFVLSPKFSIDDDVYLFGKIYFQSTSMYTKYIYAHFGNLPLVSFLRVGLDQPFIKPSRKTERYPLAGNSFWRDNTGGIFAGGEFDPLYWRFSYTSGFEINQKAVTEDKSLNMLHDTFKKSNYTSPAEVGVGLGFKHKFEKLGKFDILGFGYSSKMSEADESFLNDKVTGYNSDERGRSKYGLNLNYSLSGANLFTQFIKAQDGDLDRVTWYIQPSYKIKLANRKYFYAIEPLFRYGTLSLNIDEAVDDSLTWDRTESTVALITDVYKNIKLKLEYTIDRMMELGVGGTKDYGEFVAQLEVKI